MDDEVSEMFEGGGVASKKNGLKMLGPVIGPR